MTTSIDQISPLILDRLERAPNGSGPFSLLFEGMGVDYDAARDAVFQMLQATPRMLLQEFDEQSGAVVLRRPK